MNANLFARKIEMTKTEAKEKTVKEVWDGILAKTTEEEQTVIYALIGEAAKEAEESDDEDDEEEF